MKTIYKISLLIILLGINSNAIATENRDRPEVTTFINNTPMKDISLFPKWARIVESGELNIKGSHTPCFSDLIAIQQQASVFDYLAGNAWQLPNELERSKEGQCVDVAIWKYKELKKRGWDAKNLIIWIVLPRGTQEFHAILVARINNEEWLLNSPAFVSDLHIPRPIRATKEYMNNKFIFIYKFNENGWLTNN